MFKIYDEPNWSGVWKVCEPESPNEGCLFKIYDEPESPNRGACLKYMMNPTGLACLRYIIAGIGQCGGVFKVYDSRNRQMRGVFKYINMYICISI